MFRYYTKTDYKIDNYHTLSGIDITKRIKINEYILAFGGINARNYTIKEGERPETISSKIYSRPDYAYAILLLNNIHNLYDEWPRDSVAFKNYIVEKYGSITAANSEVAFYYTGDGYVISQELYASISDNDKYTETHYQYEDRLNDEKREIKLMNPSLIRKMEIAIQEIMNSTENL